LTDSKNSPKSGKFLEILGFYDARNAEKAQFKNDKVKYWISQGAKLSTTVHNLLVERKVIEGKKINNLPKKTAIVSDKPAEESKPAEAPSAPVETESNTQAPEEVSSSTEAEQVAPEATA
jgi:ribosomal protein S16